MNGKLHRKSIISGQIKGVVGKQGYRESCSVGVISRLGPKNGLKSKRGRGGFRGILWEEGRTESPKRALSNPKSSSVRLRHRM